MKPHNASLRMSHKTGLHKSICIISVGITSNTHRPNKLTQGVFFCSGSSEQHRLLIMLIHSVSCCSALMGTSVNTVSLALMSICVCVCVCSGLWAPGNVYRSSPVQPVRAAGEHRAGENSVSFTTAAQQKVRTLLLKHVQSVNTYIHNPYRYQLYQQ